MPTNINLLALNCSNWRSVNEAVKFGGKKINIFFPNEIRKIPKNSICIIPGIGHISSFVNELENAIHINDLKELFKDKNIKTIGICLGFHFMCKNSQEKIESECLGIFNKEVKALYQPPRPSVGWKRLSNNDNNKNFSSEKLSQLLMCGEFYFTHSYGIPYKKTEEQIEVWNYLPTDAKLQIAAIINKNYIGFQFHPEKSGVNGISLLSNSIDYLLEN